MTKEEFINLVSKIEQTGEDEFKAEYNSPELIWEKVIMKDCTTCKGKGKYMAGVGSFSQSFSCKECGGKGKIKLID